MPRRPILPVRLPLVLTLLIGLFVIVAGCSDSRTASSPPAPSANTAADASGATAPTTATGSVPEGETWDVYFIQGARVGYGRTTIRHADRSGARVLEIDGLNHLAIKRFGETTEQEVRFRSVETTEGKLIEFSTEIQMGDVPMRTTGRVVGDRLEMQTSTQGKASSTSIPWSNPCAGPYASEETLLRSPLLPGQTRTLQMLVPGFNQVATVEMAAQAYEPVRLLTGVYDLLRINTVMRFPDGNSLKGAVWSNRTGETLKTRTEAMAMETYRATKALALEKSDPAKLDFDLGTDVAVKVDRPISRPHQTKQVRYRVHLDGGDPAAVFVTGPSQRVVPLDAHTAEVTVYALRPGQSGGNPDAPNDPPTADDRQPNALIQSDDPKIVAMAKEAAGDLRDPWQVAVALERYVGRRITKKGFSQAFATAAEVAENPVGDCTEHAVLLVALARARGIPARAALGLVYMEGVQSFGYHMWAEVYVDGRWIPLDATLCQGGTGAAHLKLAQTNLKDSAAYASFLPVIQVTGRLKIEVEEVQ